jgi:ABC-2 type transport system permease protein
MFLSTVQGVALAQFRSTRNYIEDLLPVLSQPLFTIVSIPIFLHAGRPDLVGYGLVAAVLMTIGQMAFFVASEVMHRERQDQTLELLVASPANYALNLGTRVLTLTSIGLVGFVESWLLAWLVFGIRIVIHHPVLLGITLLATTFAAAGSAVLTSALFSLTRNVRTIQHAFNGPLYLLGGVLVPVAYLPPLLQHLSPCVFFYWSANLLRASLSAAAPAHVAVSLAAILGLGSLAALAGIFVMRRLLYHLRGNGALGLT